MKLFRLILITAVLAAGFAFFPSHEIASAECINASGGSVSFTAWGPVTMPAGATINVTMTALPTTNTFISIWAYGAYQVYSILPGSQSVSYTLPVETSDVVIEIAFQFYLPENAYTIATSGCGEAGRDQVTMPAQAVVGKFVANTELLSAPDANAGTGIVMEIGKTLWVYGVDSSGLYYKVLMSGDLLWVPVSSMGPNFDEVWNGTPLPATVVN